MKEHFICVYEGLITHKEIKDKFNVHEGKKPFKRSHRFEEGFTLIKGLQEHFESLHEGE